MRAADGMKFCPKCQETKPVDQFGRDQGRPDELRPYCKACRKVEGAADFQKHKAKRVAKHMAWQSSHRAEASAYSLRWNERHPDKRKAIIAAHNVKRDPEENRQRCKDRYHRDPDKWLSANRKWRQENRSLVAAITKAYRQANPELISALKRSYKARKKGAEGHHTGDDIKRILERQGWRCVYCPASLRREYHVDHIIPLSKRGSNWPSNLQCLCGPCNLRKKDKDPIEFARSLELLL